MAGLIRHKHKRDWLLQALFAGVIITLVLTATLVAVSEMQRKNVTSGFSFLWRSTGWDLGFSLVTYSIRDPYWWALLIGLLNTIVVGYLAILAASLLGLLIAVARMSANAVLRAVAVVYIDIIRNVPPILQVFIWYAVFTALPRPRDAIVLPGGIYLSARGIAFPSLTADPGAKAAAAVLMIAAIAALCAFLFAKRFAGWPARKKAIVTGGIGLPAMAITGLLLMIFRPPASPFLEFPKLQGFGIAGGSQIPPEVSAIFCAMMVYGSAYIAEVVRAGFEAVPKGLSEAGKALGLSPWQVFRKIQFPLAFRYMLPALANQYVWLIKATTLGVAVGFADLFLVVSSSINQIGQPIELMAILVLAFWILSHGMSWAANRLNAKLALKG